MARAIARARLERAIERAAPLLVTSTTDAAATIANEEVHDFRVALRRLRSWLRAAADLLHRDIPRADRAALRSIARRAGAARDAQVQWHWLTSPEVPFSAPAARAAHWLAEERLATYAAEREALQRRAGERWPPLATALAAALAPGGDAAPAGDDETLAEHLAPVLVRHLASAQRALDRIEHRTQVAAIHNARIKVKRLRYLIEALGPQGPSGAVAVRRLRVLQDALGELHDAHVIEVEIEPLLAAPRAGRAARGGARRRPALRDLRALRAALRRRELAAFRASLDLAGSPEMAAMWRDPAAFAHSLLRGKPTRQVAPRAAAAARLPGPPDHAPVDRRG